MNFYELKTKLFNHLNQLINLYNSNPTDILEIKYNVALGVYEKINYMYDEQSIRLYLDEILKKSISLEDEYNKLRVEYENETNPVLKSKRLKELNKCGARISGYNEMYNICYEFFTKSASLSTTQSSGATKKVAPVTPVTNPNVKLDAKKSSTTINANFPNADSKLSDKIIKLLEHYYDLDKNTTEAKRLQEEIYRLRIQREEQFKLLYGNRYRVFISEIESIENIAAMSVTKGFESRQLDCSTYISELRKTINAINEYHFIDELQIRKYYRRDNNLSDGSNDTKFYKSYRNFLRKFYVLIKSLFADRNVVFDVDGEKISTDDFLSYLKTCNLDGDFSVYKSKFSSTMIGNKAPDKYSYNYSLSFLNKCINSLCELVKSKIKDGKVSFVDDEPTKKDYITSRDKKLKEIYMQKLTGALEIKANNHERI